MRRPIGIWIATAYLLAMLVPHVSSPASPLWSGGSPFAVTLSLGMPLLGIVLLMSLSRWAVLATAIMAGMQAAFYLVFAFDPASVVLLLGLGSPSHDVYVAPIENHLTPLVGLAATTAIALYSAWLWRRGVLR
ncbi:MAG TPA: hypothetical protein VHI72_15825 [Hyphomicrobiaceae bacterium]|jgi:hypothetical protein|nr:hypothetical protein [Hyphomicrobiaceae bacterium]